MKNSYVIENGKVFVSDHDGVITTREYDNNIEQILVEENILESMQEEMKEIEEFNIYQNKLSKRLISPKIPYLTLFSLGLFCLLTILIPNSNPNFTMAIVSDFIGGLCSTITGLFGDFIRYEMRKIQLKREERYDALKLLESKQKSKIESLKNVKKTDNIKTNVESITLDHNKEKETIDKMIREYMDSINPNNRTIEEHGPVKTLIR